MLADGASTAGRLPVTADQVLADDTDTRLWPVTNLRQPGSGQVPPQAIRRVDLAGHAHTPRYRIPDGYVAWQGVTGGLLLLALAEQGPADTSLFALWNPRGGRVLRRYDRVLASTATTIAWVAAGCGPKHCPVHLSDLAAGADTRVASPPGAWATGGAFSPDGRYLAVVFHTGVGPSGAATQATVGVVDTATRQQLAVPGAVMRVTSGLPSPGRRMAPGCCCRPPPTSTPISSPPGGPVTRSCTSPGGNPQPANT